MNIANTVSGNVGAAPEIRDVNKVANFSVAVNESYTNKAGEKVENTRWYRIRFGILVRAKALLPLLSKICPSCIPSIVKVHLLWN